MVSLHKSAEKISHLNLALRAIRSINRLLVREKDRNLLLRGICDILIKNRGYDKVWIVVIDESGKILYTEQVSETIDEPNYDAAISSLS